MGFRERTVKGIITDVDGKPVKNAKLVFGVDAKIGFTDTHIVVDRTVTTTTSETGAFSISLWCDEDSLVPIDYWVRFPQSDNGEGDAQHQVGFRLAYGDGSPIDISAPIAMGTPAPSPITLLYNAVDGRIDNRLRNYDPDRNTGNAVFRDDFTGATLDAGWKRLTTMDEMNISTDKSLLKYEISSGENRCAGVMRNLPTANNLNQNFTVVGKLHLAANNIDADSFFYALAVSRLAASDDARDNKAQQDYLYLLGVNNQPGLRVIALFDTDREFYTHSEINSLTATVPFPTYFKMRIARDGTAYYLFASFSYDGLQWLSVENGTNIGASAPQSIGVLATVPDGGGNGYCYCDWIAVYAGDISIIGG